MVEKRGGNDLSWRLSVKVGDLVRYRPHNTSLWSDNWIEAGIVVRCIPGTDKRKVVLWASGPKSSYPERDLEIVSESR